MAEAIEFVLLNLVQKVKAGKASPRNFVGTIKEKINFLPYNLTKTLGKVMSGASWGVRTDKGKADAIIEEIAEFYGWDEEDMTLTENKMEIAKQTNEGIKVKSLSKMIKENSSSEAGEGSQAEKDFFKVQHKVQNLTSEISSTLLFEYDELKASLPEKAREAFKKKLEADFQGILKSL